MAIRKIRLLLHPLLWNFSSEARPGKSVKINATLSQYKHNQTIDLTKDNGAIKFLQAICRLEGFFKTKLQLNLK